MGSFELPLKDGARPCARRLGPPAAPQRAVVVLESVRRAGGVPAEPAGRVKGPRSGWPGRSLLGASCHLGNLAYAATASGTVQFSRVVQSVGDALVFCAGLARFGRRGEAHWCGQEDTGGTRAAFRAGGRQFAFRHRTQLRERPALLAHIFVRRHRPPASDPNASGPVRRDLRETIPVDGQAVNAAASVSPGRWIASISWPTMAVCSRTIGCGFFPYG
jgi:hypothetical protein